MTDQASTTSDAEEARKREARERWEQQARDKGWVRFNFNGSAAGRELAKRIGEISRECSHASSVELLRALLVAYPDAVSAREPDHKAGALLAALDARSTGDVVAALADLGVDVVQRSLLIEAEEDLERERRARASAEEELLTSRAAGNADPQELQRLHLKMQVLQEEADAAGELLAAERDARAHVEAALKGAHTEADDLRAEVKRLTAELSSARPADRSSPVGVAGLEGSAPAPNDLGGIDAGPRLSAPARPDEEAPRGFWARVATRLGGGRAGKARRIAVASAIGCFAASGLALVMSQGMGARESTAEAPRMALPAPSLGTPGAGEVVGPLPGLVSSAEAGSSQISGDDARQSALTNASSVDPLPGTTETAGKTTAGSAGNGGSAVVSEAASLPPASLPARSPAKSAVSASAALTSQGGASAGSDLFGLLDTSKEDVAKETATGGPTPKAADPVAAPPSHAVPPSASPTAVPPAPSVPGLVAREAEPDPPKPETTPPATRAADAEMLAAALDEAMRMLERAAQREAQLIEQAKSLKMAAAPVSVPPKPPAKPVQPASARLDDEPGPAPCAQGQRLAEVRHGETLARAAQRLGLRLERIYEGNPGLEPTAPNLPLSRGQICIPIEG